MIFSRNKMQMNVHNKQHLTEKVLTYKTQLDDYISDQPPRSQKDESFLHSEYCKVQRILFFFRLLLKLCTEYSENNRKSEYFLRHLFSVTWTLSWVGIEGISTFPSIKVIEVIGVMCFEQNSHKFWHILNLVTVQPFYRNHIYKHETRWLFVFKNRTNERNFTNSSRLFNLGCSGANLLINNPISIQIQYLNINLCMEVLGADINGVA